MDDVYVLRESVVEGMGGEAGATLEEQASAASTSHSLQFRPSDL